jgi:glycerol-3-phosphate dehydrogenase
MLRQTNVRKLGDRAYDVLVIGGGINGAVSAACLAARGAQVALIDRGDFAGETSQESSNLAWGGIKYMESYDFGLVRKLCRSRNHLIRSYPSTVQEIRFLLSHPRGFRHGLYKLYAGTWLYWVLGGFFTRAPRLLSQHQLADEEPLIESDACDGGFEYSDAYLHDNDARFVWNFVRSALDHGAVAANYAESMGSRRDAEGWTTRARDLVTGQPLEIRSKVLVNACGPYVDEHNSLSGTETEHRHVLSKGIHLIVPRLTRQKRVMTFFADDGRPFFVIPMGPRSSIGTTDTMVDSPHSWVTADDRRFVLDNINKRLRLPAPLTESDVIAERCGVRPLVMSGHGDAGRDFFHLSRKHVVEVSPGQALVSIFGGKLTDCLNVGEEVAHKVRLLGVRLPFPRARWYGEPPAQVRDVFFHQARLMDLDGMTSATSSERLSVRLWRRYGQVALTMLDEIRRDPRMGELLIEGAEYIRVEIALGARREMITRLADFLRRRSKIALVIGRQEIRRAPGLRDAARLLFGDQADARIDEYFRNDAPRIAPLQGEASELSERSQA